MKNKQKKRELGNICHLTANGIWQLKGRGSQKSSNGRRHFEAKEERAMAFSGAIRRTGGNAKDGQVPGPRGNRREGGGEERRAFENNNFPANYSEMVWPLGISRLTPLEGGEENGK
jgi:hypothetical protein